MEEDELKRPIARKVLSDRSIYHSRPMPVCSGLPVVSDLGEARFGKEKHYGDIMPGIYRAPEVILEMEWDYKVDIWSIGNMIWDLAESHHLFFAKENGTLSDEQHLAEMVSLMGPPPPEFLMRSKRCERFWDAEEFLESQLAKYQPQESDKISKTTHQLQSQDGKVGNKDISGAQSESLDPIDDITDVLGGLSIGEGDQLRYFGSRSNLSFMERQGAKPFTFRQNPNRPLQPIGVDPEIREELLDIYWNWQNPWQYLVYQKVFLRSLEAQLDDGYCTPLLLHSMLALAARYSDNPKVRTVPNDSSTAGDGFSQKAQALLFEEIKAPRVSTIVAAAHLSLFEMAKDNEPSGWIYLGIAIRMAYNLGLHINPHLWVSSGSMTPDEVELRSIAWWGCYMIEK
ncbi:hypothetical protein RIB2604_01902460 [Aspergillus luchuensis]|uniref:Protein kinase domain-containing protein n=1 Tax=Aspergillus kawachii TaxID=1069201 RepID=A0A146FJB8_ASPKA|nr:hypothetical protein RIB2604_01902460 [Aspergillus luchuensis]